jgi:hypothetical protein
LEPLNRERIDYQNYYILLNPIEDLVYNMT